MTGQSQPLPHNELPRSVLGWLRLWFTLREPVGRWPYVVTGVGLMLVKYTVEATVLSTSSGFFFTPLHFVTPSILFREKFFTVGAFGWTEVLGICWVLWSLPFLWIALSMSVRRALDAGKSPWNGLWILVPFGNLVAMIVLALLPSAPATEPGETGALEPEARRDRDGAIDRTDSLWATLGGIAIGALYATVTIQLSIYAFESYGLALFYGTPTVTGAATAYLLNLHAPSSYKYSVLVAALAVFFAGVGLLLFAAEGVICLVMAAPLILPLGLLGGILGKFIADTRRLTRRTLFGCLMIVPLLSGIESRFDRTGEFMVASMVDIAAPAEGVWANVISFSPIDEPLEWYFRLGIAAPMAAEIDGQGVGAVRECRFTTGSFIEPITVWEAPHRLAFDVSEQPDPMFELTPYNEIHPPHLEGAFLSERGEFELIDLGDGTTRLVGRTWYTLDIEPHGYWAFWADWIVHRIHLRVLRHIKQQAESEAAL